MADAAVTPSTDAVPPSTTTDPVSPMFLVEFILIWVHNHGFHKTITGYLG